MSFNIESPLYGDNADMNLYQYLSAGVLKDIDSKIPHFALSRVMYVGLLSCV